MQFIDAVKSRHSEYVLDDKVEVSQEEILSVIRDVATAVPSAYNCQSARAFVLFGEDHKKLWSIVMESLRRKINNPERFKSTEEKIESFAAAAGTVLYYEIDAVTEGLVSTYPSYAKHFPNWAEQGNAILQFAVWTALRDIGLGASVQHYNPLIDDEVREVFGIPEGYRLIAQMPFGRIAGASPMKERLPATETVVLGHAKKN